MARKKFKCGLLSGLLFGVGSFGGIHGHGCLQEFDPGTAFELNDEGVVFNLSHTTVGTADGYNEISFLDLLNKYFLVFCLFLLWPNHEEVKYGNDGTDKDHLLYDAILGLQEDGIDHV